MVCSLTDLEILAEPVIVKAGYLDPMSSRTKMQAAEGFLGKIFA